MIIKEKSFRIVIFDLKNNKSKTITLYNLDRTLQEVYQFLREKLERLK